VPNPFDDADRIFLVIVNAEGQHSLWPADFPVPAGWDVVHDPDSRSRCVEYVNENWTDMRPASIGGQRLT